MENLIEFQAARIKALEARNEELEKAVGASMLLLKEMLEDLKSIENV